MFAMLLELSAVGSTSEVQDMYAGGIVLGICIFPGVCSMAMWLWTLAIWKSL
jgi:hypothetical protein